MKTLLIILLLSNVSFAKTKAQCMDDVILKMNPNYTTEEVTKVIMECNVIILEGFKLRKGNNKVKTRVDSEAKTLIDQKISFYQKTNRLLGYEYCVDISSKISQYVKKCAKGLK